jgi:hypothetical protein
MSKIVNTQKTKLSSISVDQPSTGFSETEFFCFRPIKIGDLKISTANNTILYVLQRTRQIQPGDIQSLEIAHHSNKGSLSHVKKSIDALVSENKIEDIVPQKQEHEHCNPQSKKIEVNLPNSTKHAPTQKKQIEKTLVHKHQLTDLKEKKATESTPQEKKNISYRPITVENLTFPTASKAAMHLLKNTNYSQSEIARRCGVSQSCVCQLSAKLK